MTVPVSASTARCSFLQVRRALAPCFSCSHSPAPKTFSPVLSISKWTGPSGRRQPLEIDVSFIARRLKVLWSGTLSATSSSSKMDVISPSVWRNGK